MPSAVALLRARWRVPIGRWDRASTDRSFAWLDPDWLHLRDDRLVGNAWGLLLQQFGGIGKNFAAGIVSTCTFGGVFISTVGSIMTGGGE
jgi:hypothetical protein